MEIFEDMFILDPVTGRIPGVSAELGKDGNIVFKVDKSSKRITTADELPEISPDLFLEFVQINERVRKRWSKELKERREAARAANIEKYRTEEILAFANRHGPLFGFRGMTDRMSNQIEEPLKDWVDALYLMERTLLVDIYVERGEVGSSNMEEFFSCASRVDYGELSWFYQFVPRVYPGGLYRTLLRDDFDKWFTTNDGTQLAAFWQRNHAQAGAVAIFMVRGDRGAYDPALPDHAEIPIPFEVAMSAKENVQELPSLLKVMAEAHTSGMYLGYRSLYSACETKAEGAYQVLSDSLLSYMWQQLAQSYSRQAFRICANPRCESIIVQNTGTGTVKRFCSDSCRAQVNNAKLTEEERRGRESFYAANDAKTVYRDAFGVNLDPKDPECKVKVERLNRWIKQKWRKTKKGQIALKNGAMRHE